MFKLFQRKKITVLLPCFLGSLLVLLAFFCIWSEKGEAKEAAVRDTADITTVLLAGVDEAGNNTDMLMLCTFHRRNGSVKLIQIPRDTYYRTEKGEGKINRVYRISSAKNGKNVAAESLVKVLEKATGHTIDGYVVFGAAQVARVVDLLGGVTVNLPSDVVYYNSKLGKEQCITAGRHTLSGEEALAFVRHRKSYTEGDLGRLDAQMRFWASVFEALPSFSGLDSFLTIYKEILPNLLTNLEDKDIIDIIMAYFKNRNTLSVEMMRLPGEACYLDGIWYYVLHRAATEKMLAYAWGTDSLSFDTDGHFTSSVKETVKNIANVSDASFRVYSPKEANEKKILHH